MNTPVREGETIEGSRTMRNRPYHRAHLEVPRKLRLERRTDDAAHATRRMAARPSSSADEETRQCIRGLVACIRAKGSGAEGKDVEQASPVEAQACARHPSRPSDGVRPPRSRSQLRKVVQILSLSDDELTAMPEDQRSTVLQIRQSTLEKMRLAKASGGSGLPVAPGSPRSFAASAAMRSSPLAIPGSLGRASVPREMPAMASSFEPGFGTAAHSAPAAYYHGLGPAGAGGASSLFELGGSPPPGAPPPYSHASPASPLPGPVSPMPPPAFYVRKTPPSSSGRESSERSSFFSSGGACSAPERAGD